MEQPIDTDADALGIITLTVLPEEAGERLDVWLVRRLPEHSRSFIQMLLQNGCVTGGSKLKANAKIKSGEVFEVTLPEPEPLEVTAEDIPLDVVYEDGDIIVINKPAGLVVHPACGHASGTLVNALLFHCKDLAGIGGVQRPGIVHRLDKDTSGLLVVAKNDLAMNSLKQAFQEKTIQKTYFARTHGRPNPMEGTIRTLIGRHPIHRQKMAVVERNGKEAITHYKLQNVYPDGTALVQCKIETGRTHQIRVHTAHIGCPIAGDAVYGSSMRDKKLTPVPVRQLLHAAELTLQHPRTGASMTFKAPFPADFILPAGPSAI